MAGEFGQSVEVGLKIAKRVRSGRERTVQAPALEAGMEKTLTYNPTAPMVYAVITDPGIVDNPEIQSYQPHVYGRCDPPALIPLQMHAIEMDVDCCLDSAFVSVRGSWRLHCVLANKRCDCRLALPMGEQGSILGIEIDVAGRTYSNQIIQIEETQDKEKVTKDECGGFLTPQIFSLIIPQVYGGSFLSIKVSWFQRLLYIDDLFSIKVPFAFPEYVTPFEKKTPTRQKIQLNVNTVICTEVVCKMMSHPLKEIRRQMGKLGFLYEADVTTWSSVDFCFSYMVCLDNIYGGLLFQSPSMHDFDQREMFCLYLFPGKVENRKVFRKSVVFLVDTSGSMQGRPLENANYALAAALTKLNPSDSFNIIAFNEGTDSFSSSLEVATWDTIENASQWMSKHFVAQGGTNILRPLNEAMGMLSNCRDSVPLIFLITDGSIEDEQNICHTMKTQIKSRGYTSPRISTFGIGLYCNHYFLRMLALISGGYYDAAYDGDSIKIRMQRWFTTASSSILTNVSVDSFYHLDAVEVHPFPIPDLSSECPLILWGRYQGKFPDSVKLNGTLADMSNTVIDMKVHRTKDIPLDKIFATRQICVLTADAWFSESKELEDEVTKISMQTGFTSEYTRMVLTQSDKQKQTLESAGKQKAKKIYSWKNGSSNDGKRTLLNTMALGFGNVTATTKNMPALFGEDRLSQSNDIMDKVTGSCSRIAYSICCPCFIRTCSRMNDECCIVVSQLCAALSCIACLNFCAEICCEWDCT